MEGTEPIDEGVLARDGPPVAVDLRRGIGLEGGPHLPDAVGAQPIFDGRRNHEVGFQPARLVAGDPLGGHGRRGLFRRRQIEDLVFGQEAHRREFRAQGPLDRCPQVFQLAAQVIRRKREPHGQHPAGSQAPADLAEEFQAVEPVDQRRAGIGQVDDHDIVGRRRRTRRQLAEKEPAVGKHGVHARIVQRRAPDGGDVFLRQSDQARIEFDVIHALRPVLEDLAERPVEAVADQQDAPGIRMRQHGEMRQLLAGQLLVLRAEQQAVPVEVELVVDDGDGQMAVDRVARLDEVLPGKTPSVRLAADPLSPENQRDHRRARQEKDDPQEPRPVAEAGAQRESGRDVQAAEQAGHQKFAPHGPEAAEQEAPRHEARRFPGVGAALDAPRFRRGGRGHPGAGAQHELRAQHEAQRSQGRERKAQRGQEVRHRAGHRAQQRAAGPDQREDRRQEPRREDMAGDQRARGCARRDAQPAGQQRAQRHPGQPREQRPADEEFVAVECEQQLADQQHLRHERRDAQRDE